jgi:hypothetical protein
MNFPSRSYRLDADVNSLETLKNSHTTLNGFTVGTCLVLWVNRVYIIFNVLLCRLQKDWEAARLIIYRRWTVESVALGKHTAQSSSLVDINESWQWQWPWEVIRLVHPVLLQKLYLTNTSGENRLSIMCWTWSWEGDTPVSASPTD